MKHGGFLAPKMVVSARTSGFHAIQMLLLWTLTALKNWGYWMSQTSRSKDIWGFCWFIINKNKHLFWIYPSMTHAPLAIATFPTPPWQFLHFLVAWGTSQWVSA
jgi:hypothetical protein